MGNSDQDPRSEDEAYNGEHGGAQHASRPLDARARHEFEWRGG
jgi:hypothetical protein